MIALIRTIRLGSLIYDALEDGERLDGAWAHLLGSWEYYISPLVWVSRVYTYFEICQIVNAMFIHLTVINFSSTKHFNMKKMDEIVKLFRKWLTEYTLIWEKRNGRRYVWINTLRLRCEGLKCQAMENNGNCMWRWTSIRIMLWEF
jgi:hypothetical protein